MSDNSDIDDSDALLWTASPCYRDDIDDTINEVEVQEEDVINREGPSSTTIATSITSTNQGNNVEEEEVPVTFDQSSEYMNIDLVEYIKNHHYQSQNSDDFLMENQAESNLDNDFVQEKNKDDNEVLIIEQNDDNLNSDGNVGYDFLMQPETESVQGVDEINLYSSSIWKATDDESLQDNKNESMGEKELVINEQNDNSFEDGFEILGEVVNVSNQTSDNEENENQGDESTFKLKEDGPKEMFKEEEKVHVEPTLKFLLTQFKEENEKNEKEYQESLIQSWISDLFPQFHISKNYKHEKDLGIPFFTPAHEDDDDELLLGYKSRPSLNHTSMCILCYKWVLGEKELSEHMAAKHSQLYFYKCRICFKRFMAPFQRSRHEKIHKYDMKFPYNFYTPREDLPIDYYVPNHWRKRLKPALFTYSYINNLKENAELLQKWECTGCDWSYDNEEDLTQHYDLAHKSQECQYCYERFDNGIEFMKHLKIVHKQEPAVNYEGGMFAVLNDMEESYALLVSTIEEEHCYARPRYERPRNGAKRTRKEPFRRVYNSDDEQSKKPSNFSSPPLSSYSSVTLIERRARRRDNFCKLCSEDFGTPENYVRHMANVHATEKPYACSYCHRRFGTQSNKKEHERIHTGERPYKCVICERGFTQISNLKKHISTHGEENHLKCQVCSKQFIKETSLILHQRAHAADRKYKCTICSRAYNYSSLLNRHMRLHTGDTPYSCYDCGKMFHESLLLDYHIKKYHTGERIKCIHCEKAFILTSDLKKHLKIHARQGLPMPSDFMSDEEDDELDDEEEDEESPFMDKATEEDLDEIEHEEREIHKFQINLNDGNIEMINQAESELNEDGFDAHSLNLSIVDENIESVNQSEFELELEGRGAAIDNYNYTIKEGKYENAEQIKLSAAETDNEEMML